MQIGLQRFSDIQRDLDQIKAHNAHELMRAMEVSMIRDCAEMAARASLFRAESRWGCTTIGSITRSAMTATGSAIAT